MQTANLWLSRYAKFVVLVTFGLIYLGAMVTSLNAGLSVPDWPTSFGYNMFTFPFSKWVNGVEWEHPHRLLASLVGLLTTALMVWIFLSDRRGWVRKLGAAAFVLVVMQGIMGGLRVTEISTLWAILHGCTAQAFLCVLVLLALALSPAWLRPPSDGISPQRMKSCRAWAWVLTGAIYIQLILGATMRHLHAGLAIPTFPLTPEGTLMPRVHNAMVDIHFAHRFWAVIVTVLVFIVAVKALRLAKGEARLIRPAWTLMLLLLVQLALGASIIWLLREPIPTSFHVLNGAAVLVTSFVLSIRASRFSLAATLARNHGTAPLSAAPLPL